MRTRPKGSNTPWMEIPPVKINHNIPNFEIGTYDDIVNPENNPPHGEEEEVPMEEQELEDISNEIARMNNEGAKRIRSPDNTSQGKKKSTRIRTNKSIHRMSQESSEEESDGEQLNKNILNSTPISTTGQQPPDARRMDIFTVPETPNPAIQPLGRVKPTTIPETPEPEEHKRIFTDPTKDKDIINELVNTKQNKLTNHA